MGISCRVKTDKRITAVISQDILESYRGDKTSSYTGGLEREGTLRSQGRSCVVLDRGGNPDCVAGVNCILLFIPLLTTPCR